MQSSGVKINSHGVPLFTQFNAAVFYNHVNEEAGPREDKKQP